MQHIGYLLVVFTLVWPCQWVYAEQASMEQRSIQGIGYVEPTSEVRRLAFKHPGILGEYKVQIGQHVKTGDILAVQNNTEEQANVAVAESRVLAAKAQLDKVLAGVNQFEINAKKSAQRFAVLDAEYARRKQERIERLQKGRFASEDELDLAGTQAKLKQADSQRLAAETQYLTNFVREVDKQLATTGVALAEAELHAAKQRLAETFLVSPIDGTVLENILRVGESTYAAGSPETALLMGNLVNLRVRAEIDENYAFALREGQTALIFGRGLGGKEIPGHVGLVKQVMGKKTVFAKTATERKDIDVIQIFIEPDKAFQAPVGLEVNVKIQIDPKI
ncbi:HlyD family secretion protein [Methylomonas methanica]|jgi:multidrug resistance efflux pump|uniref:RND efflux pump membrane fusion protein barrel-sandwich domain-containing protein n=1 Tax=Methylomonas methanica TaxID=421 RepID=A0A177LY05_METMH|nr:hypothetical protein [Methylomonas methanica]OAH98345.1 hypothetical protein A1332_20340 [Methylomonas methanica]